MKLMLIYIICKKIFLYINEKKKRKNMKKLKTFNMFEKSNIWHELSGHRKGDDIFPGARVDYFRKDPFDDPFFKKKKFKTDILNNPKKLKKFLNNALNLNTDYKPFDYINKITNKIEELENKSILNQPEIKLLKRLKLAKEQLSKNLNNEF